MAEAAECYWLLDIIASYQNHEEVKRLDFQIWDLKVDLEAETAVVTVSGDKRPVITQKIGYTDFPLESLRLYCADGWTGGKPCKVILLPNEN